MTRSARTSLKALAILALALPISGCGVVFGGTTKTISVVSTPSEARLTTEPLTGSFETPTTLTLERKRPITLVIWREGYEEAQFPVQRSMRAGILILDILLTGLIGVVIDAATGGWWDLQPEEVSVTLERIDDTVQGPPQIEVVISSGEAGEGTIRIEATETVRIEVVEN